MVFEHTSLASLLAVPHTAPHDHQHRAATSQQEGKMNRVASSLLALPSGAPRAAYMLLQDLIMLSCDKPAGWMKLTHLPRVLVLELLEFILSRYPGYFLQVDMFRRALCEEICGMLQQRCVRR